MKNNQVGLLNKTMIFVMAAALAVLCSGCGFFSAKNPEPAVYISQAVIELEVGETVQLAAASSDNAEVSWVSGSDAIVTVNQNGLITGNGEGETIVTAATSTALASCTVKVSEKTLTGPTDPENPDVPQNPEIFTLMLDNIQLAVGERITLKAVSSLGDEISWLSSDGKVASVTNGVVTAVSKGTAEITAKTSKVSAKCTVIVTEKQTAPDPDADKEGYRLVWRDEFNGASLDTAKWGYQTGIKDTYGSSVGPDYWGNGELQYYTEDAVSVENGSLKITATRQQQGDRPYTSGRILTRDKASFTYGYFEARMKTPTGSGMWPAFWMLPQPSSPANSENEYGSWPANGEIDIMEAKGRLENKVDTTLHFGKAWDAHDYVTKETTLSSNTDEWHVYAVDWTADAISWFVDGQKVLTVTKDRWWSQDASNQGKSQPFDKPFYILFNLAVGGMYDSYNQPDGSFTSAAMYVDYVRVYEAV